LKTFGGALRSEDPYAADPDYMAYMFGEGFASPLGRKENHYMYQMSSKTETPITTLADGSAMCVIVPQNSIG